MALREVLPASVGVVGDCVRPAGKSGEGRPVSAARLVAAVRDGLPLGELEALRRSLDVPMERLAPRLGISKATLHRRKRSGRLEPLESDRVLRFARLLGRAVDVLESEAGARQWLNSPQVGLGGAVPLDYAETEVGAREVEDLLVRIELGVYS
ncbi:MAG: DUF2384 domain-containing protein [Verrucomicrobiales bacterium]|nr:DUF2384 domain-containing protein [Verrucomicrobiales bacterium]MCP5528420.1 DUF2384 domain-containing protein [Verrucomicrobiales bacterium]